MTFSSVEASSHSGKPVTLYKFLLSANEGFPDAPAAPGQLVGVIDLDNYTQVRDLGQTSVGSCPPTSPASAICGEFPEFGFPSGITVWSAYHGGLAGTGAYFFARYDLSSLLDPNHPYVVRALARKLGGASVHISGARVDNEDGFIDGDNLNGAWQYVDFPITSGPAGELNAEFGGFDMTVGAAIITGLAFLAVYDAGLPVSGTPGLPTTQYNRTNFRRSIVYQDLTYLRTAISHTEPSQGVDDAPGTITISLPDDDPVAMEFLTNIPPALPMVTIYQYHRPPIDEPDPSDVRATLYDIGNVEHSDKMVSLTCHSILGQGDILVPTGLFQRDRCTFTTYDPLTCGVDPNQFTFEGVVSAISGLSVTVTDAALFNPDLSFFRLGALAKGVQSTMIREQDGDTMIIDEMIDGLTVGDSVRLLAGDDRSRSTCFDKFDNVDRYFALEHMPVSNPYYGQGLRP